MVEEERHITCDNDCRMSGCPSHSFRLVYESVSDTFTVYRDGYPVWESVDLNQMQALVSCLHAMAGYRAEVAGLISRAGKEG